MFALDDIRVMVYTARLGTPDAERLSLAIVLGTQQPHPVTGTRHWQS